MSEHDEHTSFIKTPQQLLVVVLLAFVVPIIGITLLVKLVVEKPSADAGALTPQSVTARIQPVGTIAFGDAAADAPKAPRSGEEVYKGVCVACHAQSVAGSPKIGDKAAWAPRIKTGVDAMLKTVVAGKAAMPPRGGAADLSDLELTRAIVFMANQSGGKFKEPAAPVAATAPAAAPAAATAPAAAPVVQAAAQDPKKIYDGVCVACHAQSVAGSPKLGDKAAWAPRIKTGVDALVKSVLAGKGAMPPKGGNAALSEADIRVVVDYMVSQSK